MQAVQQRSGLSSLSRRAGAPRAAPRTAAVPLRVVRRQAGEKVQKQDLVDEIAEVAGIPKTKAKLAVDTLVDIIVGEVADGNEVVIKGFGTFRASQRAARDGRNPKTGEKIKIPATKSPAFKAGKTFRDEVKGVSK